MPTVAAITTAVTAVGGTVYNASQQKKAQKQQQSAQRGLYDEAAMNPEALFGTKPEFEFEEYTPLEQTDPGFASIVRRVLEGNLGNLPMASSLSGGINQAISAATRQRIRGWDPSFMGALSTLQRTRNETLKGRLPYEDALAISADRGRLANDLGMAGGAGPQMAADLGMKRLDLMTNVGPGLTASIVNILNGVDPVSRHSTPQDFLINPSQAVPWAIADNQFGSTFNMTGQLTQAYLDAAPDPAAQGLFNMKAFEAGFGGGVSNGGGQMMQGVGQAMTALSSINWGSLFNGGGQAPNIYTTPSTTPGQYGQAFYTGYGGNAYPIPKATLA